MLPSVTVLTSQEITLEELKEVVLKAGGICGPELGAGNFGIIQNGDAYLAILVFPDTWHEFTTGFLDVLKHDQPDVLEEVQAKLGGEPRNSFELEIGRGLYASKMIMRPERETKEHRDPCLEQMDCQYGEGPLLECVPAPLQCCSTSASSSSNVLR